MELITHVEAMTKNISPDFSWGLHFQEVTLITVQVSAACMPLTVPRKNEPICPFLGLKCQNKKSATRVIKKKENKRWLVAFASRAETFLEIRFFSLRKTANSASTLTRSPLAAAKLYILTFYSFSILGPTSCPVEEKNLA